MDYLFQSLSILGRALKISLKTKGRASMVVSLLGFIIAFLPAAISIMLGEFTDRVQDLYFHKISILEVSVFLVILIVFYILESIYQTVSSYYSEIDKVSIDSFIESSVIDCAASVQYRYIENEGDFRDRLSFMEEYGAERVAGSMNLILKVFQYFITFISVTLAMASIEPWLVIILLVTCIPSVVLSSVQNDEVYKHNTKSMKEAAMSVHLFYIASGAEGHCQVMNTIRFTGSYPWIKQKWRSVSNDFIEKKHCIARKHLWWNIISDCLRNGIYLGILMITAARIYGNPSLGLGIFMSVYQLSKQLQLSASNMLIKGARLIGDIPYIKDFFELQDLDKEPKEMDSYDIQTADIIFDKVSFRYPGMAEDALQNISVTIRQGEKIAIVGHNGSGKSTFVNLLCGMYEPTNGSITIGGLPVYQALQSIRKKISVVFQNFGRYETSLRENIEIGDVQRIMDDKELRELFNMADADEIVSKQPNGLAEEVGTFSESGNNLSGGQWQKIALIRALYRKDSRIVILDEPTAALDPLAETELYRKFSDLTEDKTTILISHRLGITAVVDRILVFDNGKIVEDGTHEQLMNNKGIYSNLYQSQAKWYQ